MPSLVIQRRIMCDDGCKQLISELPVYEGERHFKGLDMVEEPEYTSVSGMLREMQNACYAKTLKEPS